MLLQLQRYDLHLTYQHGTDVHIADMLSRAYLEGKPSACALQLQDVEHTDDLSTSLERLEAIKSAQLLTQCSKAIMKLLSMVGLTSDLC